MKQIFKEIIETIQETFAGYGRDNGSMMAAGLAYYTIFAIAPLLVIAVAVAGVFYGDAAVQGEIVDAIAGTVGEEAAVVIQNLVVNARESTAGTLATVISSGLLLFAASGLFGQLQRALNAIWGLVPGPKMGFIHTIYKRLLAFGMVLLVGFFLLLSLAVTTVISSLTEVLTSWQPMLGPLLPWLDIVMSVVLLTLLFTLLFRILPDGVVAWRDVGVGGLATAVLFTIGRFLISWYLSTTSASSAYGAAGSLVVILLFVYYSAQILLIGAEFTRVFANRYGSSLQVDEIVVQRTYSPDQDEGEDAAESVESTSAAAEPASYSSPSVPLPPPVVAPAMSSNQPRKQAAAGLLGLALGLLMAFIFNRRGA